MRDAEQRGITPTMVRGVALLHVADTAAFSETGRMPELLALVAVQFVTAFSVVSTRAILLEWVKATLARAEINEGNSGELFAGEEEQVPLERLTMYIGRQTDLSDVLWAGVMNNLQMIAVNFRIGAKIGRVITVSVQGLIGPVINDNSDIKYENVTMIDEETGEEIELVVVKFKMRVNDETRICVQFMVERESGRYRRVILAEAHAGNSHAGTSYTAYDKFINGEWEQVEQDAEARGILLEEILVAVGINRNGAARTSYNPGLTAVRQSNRDRTEMPVPYAVIKRD